MAVVLYLPDLITAQLFEQLLLFYLVPVDFRLELRRTCMPVKFGGWLSFEHVSLLAKS